MKSPFLLAVVFLLAISSAYSGDAYDESRKLAPSDWVNIHAGNPDLAGVLVHQYPVDPAKRTLFKGRHPFVVSFVMWDGRINETYYTPSGRLIGSHWWNVKDMPDFDPQGLWHDVDFSKGSDPAFKNHHDPRTSL